MRFSLPRRWFQYRLSTWFVLVAIVACAMTPLPHFFLTAMCFFAVFAIGFARKGVFKAGSSNEDPFALASGSLVLIELAAFSALVVFLHLNRIARLEILLAFSGLEVVLFGCSILLLWARTLAPAIGVRTFGQTADLAVLAATSRIVFELLTMQPIEL